MVGKFRAVARQDLDGTINPLELQGEAKMNINTVSAFNREPSSAYLRDVIATLRAENESLRETIVQLQEAYTAPEGLTRIASFSPIEEKMLSLLIAREMVSRETMYSHLY